MEGAIAECGNAGCGNSINGVPEARSQIPAVVRVPARRTGRLDCQSPQRFASAKGIGDVAPQHRAS